MLLYSYRLEALRTRYQFRTVQFVDYNLRLGVPSVDDASGLHVRPNRHVGRYQIHHVHLFHQRVEVVYCFVSSDHLIFDRVDGNEAVIAAAPYLASSGKYKIEKLCGQQEYRSLSVEFFSEIIWNYQLQPNLSFISVSLYEYFKLRRGFTETW